MITLGRERLFSQARLYILMFFVGLQAGIPVHAQVDEAASARGSRDREPNASRRWSRARSTEAEKPGAPGSVVPTSHTLHGAVVWKGELPPIEPYEVNVDEGYCGSEGILPADESDISSVTLAVRNTVVWLERADGRDLPEATKAPADSRPVRLIARNCSLTPRLQVVPPQTRLWVTSQDDILHDIWILTPEKTERIAKLGFRSSFSSLWLRKPGLYRVRCSRHPWERAAVIVPETGFTTVSNDDGEFTFREVPSGEYRVMAWHPGFFSTKKLKAGLVEDYTFSSGATGSLLIHLPGAQNRELALPLREEAPREAIEDKDQPGPDIGR